MALIEVSGLVKVYAGGVRAVDGIGFSVAAGETFGFLGPNGAGKTTTIRILVTLLAPTEGSARVAGFDIATGAEEIRARVGYAAQTTGVDDDLTGRENVVLQARLHGLSRVEADRRSSELLDILQLSDVAGRRAGTYSGGMRRRLDLAQALVHDPEVLFLDEPTTGLDPQTRRALWGYLGRLRERGVTIFLTTQYMEEADALAERVAIIDGGRIVIEGTPDALKGGLGGDAIAVTVEDGVDVAAAATVLQPFSEGGVPAITGSTVRVFTADAAVRLAQVVRVLDGAGMHPVRLEVSEPTLDDVFLRHTGAAMRVEEVRPRSRMPFRSRRT